MKNAPILLAATSLVFSLIAIFFPPGREALPTAPRRILVDTRLSGTSEVHPCTGRDAVDSLQLLMKNRVNPTMTRLSYALHHDERSREERLGSVAEAAAVLLGCVEVTPSYRPDIGLEGLPEYYRLLERMQANTLALQTSARELDEEGTRHWFSHLKHDCNECHSRFRLASEGDVAVTQDPSLESGGTK